MSPARILCPGEIILVTFRSYIESPRPRSSLSSPRLPTRRIFVRPKNTIEDKAARHINPLTDLSTSRGGTPIAETSRRVPPIASTPSRVPSNTIRPAPQSIVTGPPSVLAEIRPEESHWTPAGTLPILQPFDILITLMSVLEWLKHAIAEDPFFLGNPEHIQLRNSSGNTSHRKVVTPPRNSPPPKSWYVVMCGTKVGIFLSWLVPRHQVISFTTLTDCVVGLMLVTASQGRARRCTRVSSLSQRRTFGSRWPSSREQLN